MKNSVITIVKAIKNHNKLYTLFAFWAIWLGVTFGFFAGTYLAEFLFFFGFMLAILWAAYITDNPNEKEQKTMENWSELFNECE